MFHIHLLRHSCYNYQGISDFCKFGMMGFFFGREKNPWECHKSFGTPRERDPWSLGSWVWKSLEQRKAWPLFLRSQWQQRKSGRATLWDGDCSPGWLQKAIKKKTIRREIIKTLQLLIFSQQCQAFQEGLMFAYRFTVPQAQGAKGQRWHYLAAPAKDLHRAEQKLVAG